MNKELVLSMMVHSFKKANIEIAVNNGVEKDAAELQIESMNNIIEECMKQVLEDLLENFPTFIQ